MTTSTIVQRPDLERLAQSVTELHEPGSEGYAAAVTPWNLAVAPAPVAAVVAHGADDVVETVQFANRHGVSVAVQSTGHGISGSGELDDAILLRTSRMRGIELHVEERWARVEAGVQWKDVLEATAPHGLAGLSGSSPEVGVVGYITGGGLGPLVRTLGLASDRVRAFEVVTGDGELRRATTTENPDLFWGLRGGKGMLGIVTAVEIDLLPISEIYGGALYFDGDDARSVLRRWADWAPTLPREATTSVALLRLPEMPGVPPELAGRLTLAVRFAWSGDLKLGPEVLAPVRATAPALIDGVDVMPYAALGAIHADPVDPMPVHEEHALLSSLPCEAVDRLLALTGPGTESPQVIVEIRQTGGAVGAEGLVPSAFVPRRAAFSLLTIGLGIPELVDAVRASGEEIISSVDEWTTGQKLPHFAPTADATWLETSYDAPTVARLRRVSAAYDPRGVIHAARLLR
jgi:hypothetical protein